MRSVSFGADDDGPVAAAILAELKARGFDVRGYGPATGSSEQWAEIGERVALDVTEGRAESGIAACYTGTGVSIAANKVRGARAALCADAETAKGARAWNDANVLCLSLANTKPEDVGAILDAWFSGEPVDETERANIDRLRDIELFAQFG